MTDCYTFVWFADSINQLELSGKWKRFERNQVEIFVQKLLSERE